MTENDAIAKFKRTSVLWESATNTEMVEAVKVAIQALEEIQQYRAIGTVEELKSLKENGAFSGIELAQIASMQMKLKEYQSIGTIEEFKALKEKNEDCIIKHLTNECSYNETGCSDCKGKETIRVAVEIVKKMYEHCEGSCVDCPYHNPNMDKCMNDLLKLK